MPPVLVLSAWEPEIAPLLRRLRARAARQANDADTAPQVHCATVGVGAVDAGINATRAIVQLGLQLGPDLRTDTDTDEPAALVIFVGTAGAYARPRAGAAIAIGTAVVAERLALISTAKLRGDGYLPEPMIVAGATAAPLAAQLLECSTAAVPAAAACPLAITRTRALGREIARATGAAVENLEVFSVARAAALAGIPFAAVLGVANQVGPRAHAEWLSHHRAASKAACDVVWAWLRQQRA